MLVEFISEFIAKNDQFYQENSDLLATIGATVSAIEIYLLGKWLNTRKAKKYIDTETGEEVIMKHNHSFFFIRMEHWGIIVGGATIIGLIKNFLN
jgi:membrane protein YqaA with SNARE-associated domain